ncbi:MAG: restriction endonuclease subunit S [Methanoregula sp.]|nr:restriction endonuclease subunit S [Methanoregula sp.]
MKLDEVATFIRGITFKPDDIVAIGIPGSVGCMRTKNVQTELDLSDVWGIPESLVKRDDQYLISGDILVSSANSWNLVGKCCWVPTLPWPATFGGFISVLRHNSTIIDPRYLFHWFSSSRTQATVRSFGQQTTNISNLNVERCSKMSIPLLPLPEQRRIAEILDKADLLRAKRRSTITQLDTLVQSIFLDMFGDPVSNPKSWPNPSVGGVLTFQQYGPRFFNESYTEEGVRIVRITDLSEMGVLDFSSMPRLNVSNEDREKYCLRPGDLIFARSGATVGKIALIQSDSPPCIAGAYFITMRFDHRVDPRYAQAVLSSPSIRSIVATRSRQAAQQNFSGPGLRQLPMPCPPVELQHEFVCRIEAIQRLKNGLLASLTQLNTLCASLQHSAFQGEL